MYFLALATDYDGTIARDGIVDAATLAALQRFKATGRRLILVTGRDLPSLKRTFPDIAVFDHVVAENGALLYDPGTEEEHVIAPPVPPGFVAALEEAGVTPLTTGRSIVATWVPNQLAVLETIRKLGLELQIIFNKGAVMVLPAGVNKASGLRVALERLNISPLNVVGVGDAENDNAFLLSCGCAAAVGNALPTLKARADVVLQESHGAGAAALMAMICRDDARMPAPQRRGIVLGADSLGAQVHLEPHTGSVLIAGHSGVGKSTLATALTERMVERGLRFCVFDPEGDYGELEHAISVGSAKSPPEEEAVIALLSRSDSNVVINAQALSLADRPTFFASLLPRLLRLRARTGVPHWLLIDEAHHLVAAARRDVDPLLPDSIPASIFITVHPDAMSAGALRTVELVIAVGKEAAATIERFCTALGVLPPGDVPAVVDGQVVAWDRTAARPPFVVDVIQPQQKRDRHKRKYAEGELDPDLSFYFRGPDAKLNLRAQNLMIFVQMAKGVDDATWQFHRRHGDYSAWFRTAIKDGEMADEAAALETDPSLDAAASRERIVQTILRRYTAESRGPRNWREEPMDAGRPRRIR